jgi:putative chitinase
MHITIEQFLEQFPNVRPVLANKYLPAILDAMAEFGIDSPNFIVDIVKASDNLTKLTETFKYSAAELQKHFPKQFPDYTLASLYEHKQDKIAIRVYSGKYGNGNEPRPDGWDYRGRGFIKIVGKDNYFKCSKALGIDLLKIPAYLETPIGAARSAAWVWSTK